MKRFCGCLTDLISVDNEVHQSCLRELAQYLLQNSYRKGTFTLTSGKTSDFYIDGKKTILSGDMVVHVGMSLFNMIEQSGLPISVVAGMTLGADPLITATSMMGYLCGRPLSQIIIRKEAKGHGTMQYLEKGADAQPGTSVALLEDVVTTGGTLFKSIDRIKADGFNVGLILVIVDREEGGCDALRNAGYDVRSVYTRTELLSHQS